MACPQSLAAGRAVRRQHARGRGILRQDWAIVDSLMGGTKAMREAGQVYLPKWPKEDDDSYKARISSSTLLPAYSETVHNMSGRVFAEPIVLGDDVPELTQGFAQNFDRQGNNLQVWSQSAFVTGLSHGLCHVFVDYPKAEGLRTAADEKAAGVRPYAILIQPEQVLGWRAASTGGEQALTQFRYMECIEEDDGAFGCKKVMQIRVLEPGAWHTYREVEGANGKKSWQPHEEGLTSIDMIPLATFYTKRTGFMTATPPLLELAYMNVKHWQSQSDQDNILHVARVAGDGATGNGRDDDRTVGHLTWTIATRASNCSERLRTKCGHSSLPGINSLR